MEIKFRANSQFTLAFLRYIFKANQGGPIKINSTNDFGRMVIGLYKYSDSPPHQADDDLTVTLILPRHQATKDTQTRYLFFSDVDTIRLNLILDALLNIDLDTYFLQGIQAGMRKRHVIEAYIISRGFVAIDCSDVLTKRTYRASLSIISKKADLLLEKARYHYNCIISPPKNTKKRSS